MSLGPDLPPLCGLPEATVNSVLKGVSLCLEREGELSTTVRTSSSGSP